MILSAAKPKISNVVDVDDTWHGRWVTGIALFGAAISIVDLIGWVCHIQALVTVVPGMPAMSALTAFAFLAASGSLLSAQGKSKSASFFALCVVLIAVCGILWFFTHKPDILLWQRPPQLHRTHRFPSNVMSPNTALLFVLLGLALLLVDRREAVERSENQGFAFQVLALTVAMVAFTGLNGNAFGVIRLFGASRVLGMAVTTGILFVLYAASVLLSRPKCGIMLVLQSDNIAGQTARRLLPIALIASLLLCSATMIALRVHNGYGFLLAQFVVTGGMILLSTLVWINTLALSHQESRLESYQIRLSKIERERIAGVLRSTQDQLVFTLEGAQLGTWYWDLITGERAWSDQCKKLLGFSPETNLTVEMLENRIHPDDRAQLYAARRTAISLGSNYSVEYRVVWDDGTTHWISARGRVERGPDGRAMRFEGIAQDISMQRLLQERQQQFLQEMLASVTDAKLRLCLSPDELPPPLTPHGEVVSLTTTNGGIRELRDAAFEACKLADHAEDRCFDMKTAVGEAAMNSAVHAKEGLGQVFVGENGIVQVKVTDNGRGIPMENLPSAALKRGYTTAGTLGHGMKMMLQTADRVFLLTGTSGTTVVIEQDRTSHPTFW